MRPRTHLQFNMSTTVLLLTMMHLNYKTWGSYMAHRQAQCWSLQHKLWGQLQGKLASPTEPPQEPCGKLLFKWKFNSSANNMWSPEGHGDQDRYPFCGNSQREDGTQTPLLKDLKSNLFTKNVLLTCMFSPWKSSVTTPRPFPANQSPCRTWNLLSCKFFIHLKMFDILEYTVGALTWWG